MAYLGVDIESMKIAAEAIREGKLVSFPTETVYGLGRMRLIQKLSHESFRKRNALLLIR